MSSNVHKLDFGWLLDGFALPESDRREVES